MALTTLAGTKWQMKNTISADHDFGFALAFCWNGKAFSKIAIEQSRVTVTGTTLDDDGFGDSSEVVTLYQNSWKGSTVIFIAGGPSEEDGEAIEWFERNGTLIPAYTLQEKEATPSSEDQTIEPDEGFDGLSSVVVFGNENLTPENIKKGVSIFGVTGTFSGFDPSNPIAQMTNLAGSGQDQFVHDWAQMARIALHEQGVSNAFLTSSDADFLIAKAVTDLIEDGNLSATTLSLVATLRVNHPHKEDEEATQNV